MVSGGWLDTGKRFLVTINGTDRTTVVDKLTALFLQLSGRFFWDGQSYFIAVGWHDGDLFSEEPQVPDEFVKRCYIDAIRSYNKELQRRKLKGYPTVTLATDDEIKELQKDFKSVVITAAKVTRQRYR